MAGAFHLRYQSSSLSFYHLAVPRPDAAAAAAAAAICIPPPAPLGRPTSWRRQRSCMRACCGSPSVGWHARSRWRLRRWSLPRSVPLSPYDLPSSCTEAFSSLPPSSPPSLPGAIPRRCPKRGCKCSKHLTSAEDCVLYMLQPRGRKHLQKSVGRMMCKLQLSTSPCFGPPRDSVCLTVDLARTGTRPPARDVSPANSSEAGFP